VLLDTGFWIDNWIHWALTLITTNNYDNLTELHTPKITVTTAHKNYSQSSSAVASQWWTFPFLWIPELSPASATNLSLPITATLN
jgi:hypothetical protein